MANSPQALKRARQAEKARAHKIIQQTWSFKQKITAGTWGFVLRMPVGISSMLGV